MTTKQRHRLLRSLAYLEAGTCIRSSTAEGVRDRMQQQDAAALTIQDERYLGTIIEQIADRLTEHGLRLQPDAPESA